MGINYKDRFRHPGLQPGGMDGHLCRLRQGGQVAVPLMFRLAPPDIEVHRQPLRLPGLIVEEPFVKMVNEMKDRLPVPRATTSTWGDRTEPRKGYVGL